MKLEIKVRNTSNSIHNLPKIIDKGDWIDLKAATTVTLGCPVSDTKEKIDGESKRKVTFDNTLIPLGVAMKLPDGFEAYVVPRSSAFKNYGVIQSNSIGIIDSSYCGNKDEWKLPVIAFRDTVIPEGTRICQFRIQLSQKATVWQRIKWFFCNGIKLKEVDSLDFDNRGGFGSTGK